MNRLTDYRLTSPVTTAGRTSNTRQRHKSRRSSLRHRIVAFQRLYSRSLWIKRDSNLVHSYCGSLLVSTYVLTTQSMHKLTFDDTARSTHAVQYFLQRPRPSTLFGRVHPRSGWTVTNSNSREASSMYSTGIFNHSRRGSIRTVVRRGSAFEFIRADECSVPLSY